MERVIGTCSCCGGEVVVPEVWHGIRPPTPTCRRCGATAAGPRPPVIPMQPAPPASPWLPSEPWPTGTAEALALLRRAPQVTA